MIKLPKNVTSSKKVAKDISSASNLDESISRSIARGLTSRSIRLERQTKIFASMCPDEILDHYDNYETRSYNTTLMLGDVSGFTEMTEKFGKSGKNGPSKLTETLNSYIGAMVQEILSHKGDVLKFSGDAFIVMWKVEEGRAIRDIASEAIKTACVIQKHFGTYETEVGVVLRVKLAIASGTTHFTSIGDPVISSYYIITGSPVWEVKSAEKLCVGGDILVAPSCWQWVNPDEYIHEMLPDNTHTRILSMSLLWDQPEDSISDEGGYDSDTHSSSVSEFVSSASSTTSLSVWSIRSEPRLRKEISEVHSEDSFDYSLRPKLIRAAKLRLGKELRNYVLRPVIRSVEMDEPLEYLTEIRQVVIVFINVITSEMSRKTLVQLVNSAYIFVCRVVDAMQGCVNKTSLFDKDMMFLCIFGLRGDKHNLETQIGLRCAERLRQGLVNYDKVLSVTVGVTTGMTYCGVVGHVLRREYTVIGMTVNKAARLMTAYENKVVCDRSCFLLSQLESKHFILQPPIELKGITNVGPVYEFSEKSEDPDHIENVSRHPLIGRDKELKDFYTTMKTVIHHHRHQNTSKSEEISDELVSYVMIIRGDARIGKTRLLEEITYIIPKSIKQIFLTLSPNDHSDPYFLIRQLFYVPLGISNDTPPNVKEDALSSRYSSKDRALLCCLNAVFRVKFPLNDEYTDMDHRERRSLLKKYIVLLTHSCFKNLWCLLVDDLELADEESMPVFNTFLKQQKVLSILAYSHKLSKNYSMPYVLETTSLIVDLVGIERRYHAAVACQTLEVIAIPAELEKVIQEKSGGYPGWIDSYLISLLQSRGVEKKHLTRFEIHEMGLVTPPKIMIKRLPRTAVEVSKIELFDVEFSDWEMFQFCYKECVPEDGELNPNDNDTFPVCMITELFEIATQTETSIDAVLLKLYDSLTPLDQKLIKCCAVLGEVIDRKILERLMQGNANLEIAISVAKLFELRVLCCAVQEVTRLSSKFKQPTFLDLKCGCRDLVFDEVLDDLPKYAMCNMMRFKVDMFRRMTYGLLTENQKVELHNKALRYLQQTTRRCNFCGGGPFHKLLGDVQLVESDKRKLDRSRPLGMQVSSSSSNPGEFRERRRSTPSGLSAPVVNSVSSSGDAYLSVFQMCMAIKKASTRSFSQIEFTGCTCTLIQLTAYTHILEHCRRIVAKKLLLIAILEFAEVLLKTYNIPHATKLLEEAVTLVDAIEFPLQSLKIVVPFLKGRIHTLRGRCYMEGGLLNEAQRCFELTTHIMGYHFPTNSIALKMKSYFFLKQLKLTLTAMRSCWLGSLEGDVADYSNQFASCLNQMFLLFRTKGQDEPARLAAIWGLYLALQSNDDFYVLIKSYSNMFIIAHLYHYNTLIPHLETGSVNLCSVRKKSFELPEIIAVAQIYTRVFFSRWIKGHTKRAARIGFIALRLAHTVQSMTLKLWILPRLVTIVTLNLKFNQGIALLKDLKYVADNDMDQHGYTWYYGLSIDVILETGISVVSLREVDQFFQHESTKIWNLKDYEARERFFISIWLWFIRIGDFESASVWKNRRGRGKAVHEEYTVPGALTKMRYLEGLLLCYVHKKNRKNFEDANGILVDVEKYLEETNEMRRVVNSINPRYTLLKGYYYVLTSRLSKGLTLIRKVKKESLKNDNLLLHNWADLCEKSWTGNLSPIERDAWIEAATSKTYQISDEVDFERLKMTRFALPLPT